MPVATVAEGRDLVLGHIKSAWDELDDCPPLRFDDTEGGAVQDEEWARITIQHVPGGFDQRTLGPAGYRRFRRLGIVTIQVFTALGDGLTRADTLAQVLLTALQGATTATGGVIFRNAGMSEVGRDGRWNQTNVTAEFEYDTIA